MLERIDRVQLVVADRTAAAAHYHELLGAEVAREDESEYLGASRTVLALGESEIELCQPEGPGRARRHLDEHGEGLFAAGASTRDLVALEARLRSLGQRPVHDGHQLCLDPQPGFGLRFVLSSFSQREPADSKGPESKGPESKDRGPISFLYEVTNTLVSDWRTASAFYSGLFGLDPTRFSEIGSKRFGYQGTLTLFDPPGRLDRIELSQVVDPKSAMGRFVAKRGDSLYMSYVETHDLQNLIERLDAAGARWTPRGETREEEQDGLWVHPSALHGLLLGVSRTTVAWEWSGRPELVSAS